MKKKLLVGAVLLLVVLAVGIIYWLQNIRPYGKIEHFGAGPLTNTPGSVWNPLTPIPLSPDKAVLIAIQYANAKQSKEISWDVDGIRLRKYSDSLWFYEVQITDRKSGANNLEIVRVMLNGEVWKPKSQ